MIVEPNSVQDPVSMVVHPEHSPFTATAMVCSGWLDIASLVAVPHLYPFVIVVFDGPLQLVFCRFDERARD